MDFCFNCGGKTDPDWVFCRACGSVLEDTEINEPAATSTAPSGAPKVELISRGWDVVEVDAVDPPEDPLDGDEISPGPLPHGAIEISADDITVISTAEETEPEGEPEAAAAEPLDPWDHLRPHGDMPRLQRRVSVPGRIGQILAVITAVAALAAAGIHFFLNTRLDAFSEGSISASAVADVELIADISLAVVAGLLGLSIIAVGWWISRIRPLAENRPGKTGLVTLLSLAAGVTVVAISFAIKGDAGTEAIAANSLIVLGLGLIITSCVATYRTIDRIDIEETA